ncbi:LptA/OstA family protein [Brasilonema bromeliae]|uniref:OstA family protein n=1 Tax=Brasilonema bromeliae SPC951 TaxID=385972 RepID=A0ABX1PD36_9CYAN|nr:LptA/OstA family protein [Brasilonema bromeliae]NMG21776.1 OstA family protein [Brasilonema bromeliae SPC951]
MMPHYQLPHFHMRRLALALILPVVVLGAMTFPNQLQTATAQTPQKSGQNRPLYIRGKVQEYNSKTQVATIRGEVELSYPARGIQATAAQAQYFTRERQIILSGNVYVLQQGSNSIKADSVTYLIDEARFVATPKQGSQVESIYMVNDTPVNNQAPGSAPATAPVKKSN